MAILTECPLPPADLNSIATSACLPSNLQNESSELYLILRLKSLGIKFRRLLLLMVLMVLSAVCPTNQEDLET